MDTNNNNMLTVKIITADPTAPILLGALMGQYMSGALSEEHEALGMRVVGGTFACPTPESLFDCLETLADQVEGSAQNGYVATAIEYFVGRPDLSVETDPDAPVMCTGISRGAGDTQKLREEIRSFVARSRAQLLAGEGPSYDAMALTGFWPERFGETQEAAQG